MEPILILSDARGVYIPQNFAEEYDTYHGTWTGIRPEDIAILLEGPDNELYWDAWTSIENNAEYTHTNGTQYRLYQDGDVWLIPDGYKGFDFD